MTVTLRAKQLHTVFVYSWVTVINVLLAAFLWAVSPLGFVRAVHPYIGSIPSAPVDRTTLAPTVVSGDPTRIQIASQGIDLEVLPGEFNKESGTWNIAAASAHFATVSMPINTAKGNTLIYGHNNKQVFYNLRKLTPGELLVVTTNSGYTFTYKFDRHYDVQPNDLSVFRFDGLPTVTLQTCTGAWNETRGMYVFSLKSVEKS